LSCLNIGISFDDELKCAHVESLITGIIVNVCFQRHSESVVKQVNMNKIVSKNVYKINQRQAQ